MRPSRRISEEQRKRLEGLLGRTKTKSDFQRVQCVWLRAALDLSAQQTSRAIGWSPNTVKIIQSRYFRKGDEVLFGKGRGGRRYSNLTEEQEVGLLSGFMEKARSGGILVVTDIKSAYEKIIGRKVPKSTVYRLLARHGWRKIVPRPKHPKADLATQEEFKKNSRELSRKR